MKKTRYTILIMFCSIILNNSLAQTYELQKIANLLPNDAHFNFFQLQSAGNGFSIKNSWAVNGSKTENQIYEGLGNTWAIHSNYTNAFLWMRNVFKTNDNNVWALANTEPVSAPPGHNDTTYLMKFENNKWTKVKQLAVYPMGSANYGAYNFPNYNFNAHDNLHYFFIKDSIFYYETNKWKSIPLFNLNSDTTAISLYMASASNIHLLKSHRTNNPNLERITLYYQYIGNNWIVKDTLTNPAQTTIVNGMPTFIPNISTNSPLYVHISSVDISASFKPIVDLYSIKNNQIVFEKNLTSSNSKMATLTCSPNGNLYYLKHDYVWFNDTVELFQYQNNISKKLYTMTGQLGQTKSIYAFNNDVLIASFSQAAPFKSELYRLVEKKPITADFSYTIQNMTVQFTKLDTACKDFIWDFGNGNTSTINPNPIVTYQSPGTYSPCLKCGTDPAICAVITVPCNNCSGTTTNVENNANVKIKLFPNPTNGLVYFDGLTPSKKINVNIYSIQSKLISSFEIEDSGYIDISGYEQGIYLISIEKIGMYKVLKY